MEKKSTKKKVSRKSAKVKAKPSPQHEKEDNNSQPDRIDDVGGEGDVQRQNGTDSRQGRSQSAMSMTGNRKTTDKERDEILEAFRVLDEDGDGKLGFEEMKKLLQSQFMSYTDAGAAEVIQQLDEDGSGGIEFGEFEKYVIQNNLCKPTVEEFSSEMKEAFQMFDSDNNGYIDAQEFRALMGGVGDKMSEEDIAEMMKEADTNGDGLIDYKEFCTHMSKGF